MKYIGFNIASLMEKLKYKTHVIRFLPPFLQQHKKELTTGTWDVFLREEIVESELIVELTKDI